MNPAIRHELTRTVRAAITEAGHADEDAVLDILGEFFDDMEEHATHENYDICAEAIALVSTGMKLDDAMDAAIADSLKMINRPADA